MKIEHINCNVRLIIRNVILFMFFFFRESQPFALVFLLDGSIYIFVDEILLM